MTVAFQGAAQRPPQRTARLRARGLPQRLPDGEHLLWQGSPNWRALLRRTFHVRLVALYFALIIAWSVVSVISAGAPAHVVVTSLWHRVALALVPIMLIAVYAWAIQRSTIYSITSRRVVISFGLALPMTFNIPFSRIAAAGLRLYPDGAGDIPLQLLPDERMSYLALWPHTRPWRMTRTEPMLRCVARAEEASTVLGQALAAQAELPHTGAAPRVSPARATPGGQVTRSLAKAEAA